MNAMSHFWLIGLLLCFLQFRLCHSFTEAYDSNYYVGCYTSNDKNWNDHSYYCKQYLSSDLGSFHGDNSIARLTNLINQVTVPNGDTIHIGCYDNEDGGSEDWLWTDGTEFNYSNWNDQEPNSDNEECCESYESGLWNDITCSTARACFVCNYPFIRTYGPSLTYKLNFTIGNSNGDYSDDTFYIRINGSDTNTFTEWFDYTGFYETGSTYTMFAQLTNVGSECQELQILGTANDILRVTRMFCLFVWFFFSFRFCFHLFCFASNHFV